MADRLPAIDVLRGVAILGTLASNVWLFSAPGGPAALLQGGLDPAGAAQTALLTLSNGKFLALLTLLFGVGLEIQYRSAVRRGGPWPGRYPVRISLVLLVAAPAWLRRFPRGPLELLAHRAQASTTSQPP